jgi:hypothetical protein
MHKVDGFFDISIYIFIFIMHPCMNIMQFMFLGIITKFDSNNQPKFF